MKRVVKAGMEASIANKKESYGCPYSLFFLVASSPKAFNAVVKNLPPAGHFSLSILNDGNDDTSVSLPPGVDLKPLIIPFLPGYPPRSRFPVAFN